MKRVALFLLLLAIGFFALRMFDDDPSFLPDEDPGVETPPTPVGDATKPPAGPQPTPVDPPTQEPPVEGITPGGRFSATVYSDREGESKPRWFDLEAKDSRRSPDDPRAIELLEFLAKLYDVEQETNDVRLELEAQSGLVFETPSGPLQADYGDRFELTDLTANIVSGAPIVPLVLTSSAASVSVARQAESISSDASARLVGEGLELSGDGYFVDLATEELRLLKDARLNLALAGQPETELTSTDTLVLSRDGDRLVVRATGGSSIGVPGTKGGRLDADAITLVGRHLDGKYVLDRMEAVGGVVWVLGPQRFRGDRLSLRFDQQNEPSGAVLEGSPVADLVLEGTPVERLGVKETPRIELTVRGERTLRVDFRGARTEFRAVGPAIVETADGTLNSVGDVEAWQDEDEAAGFRAKIGVVLESASGERLYADELESRFDPEHGGSLLFTGRGNVRLERKNADGTRIVLTTTQGLDVVRENDRWQLVEGRDITIVRETEAGATGPEALYARADHVWDALLEGPSFRAEGDVTVRNVNGELTGQALHFVGMESFTLAGATVDGEERPARLVGNLGTVEALELTRDGDTIHAAGAVHGDLSGERLDGRLRIDADALDVTQSSTGDTRRWDIVATGSVSANWLSADATERTEIDCDGLNGSRVERLDADGKLVVSADNEWTATNVVRSLLERPRGTANFAAGRLVMRTHEPGPDELTPEDRPLERVEARGAVSFSVFGENESGGPFQLQGEGHQLTLDGLRRGRLHPLAGERVHMRGGMRVDQVPFSLESTAIVFDEERLEATDPTLELEDFELTGERSESPSDRRIKLSARTLVATPRYLELADDVLAEGRLDSNAPWDFTCERLRFEINDPSRRIAVEDLRSMFASGNVRFRLGSSEDEVLTTPVATARGARLKCHAGLRTLRLEGNPAEIATPAFRTSSTEYLEFDPEIAMLIGAGPGVMQPGLDAPDADWKLRFHSSRTFVDQGTNSYITALQEPILTDESTETRIRASWLVLWLDAAIWAEMPERMRGRKGGAMPAESSFKKSPFMGPMLSFLDDLGAGDLVREVYFEGPVEADYKRSQVSNCGAIYLNLLTGSGWLYDATLNVYGWMVGQDFDRLVVRTKWMRHAQDGSLQANSAVVTPCDYEESHLRIVTGDLKIVPKEIEGEKPLYEVSLHDNRIELYNFITIPLFPITYGSQDGYTPLLGTLSFGSSARFGTSASAGFEAPAGDVGDTLNKVMGGDPDDFRSKVLVDLSWLGSRGGLIDLGLLAESKGRYWLETRLGGLPDNGQDRGYIRVPKNERDDIRLWYRMKSRVQLDDTTWVDARVSTQTDAGVQSEFFEGEFHQYEERDNLVHLRSAQGPWYLDASVKKRFDSYRSDIEELPSLGVYRGLEPLFEVGGQSVLYTGSLRAEYLERREGYLGLQSPFAFPAVFPDGFGEQEVGRVLGEQGFEVPISLPLGMRLTPFVSLDFRAWDDDTTGGEAHRATLFTGARLSASFWREGEETLSQFAPYLELSSELDSWRDGDPYVFDRNEAEFDGDVLRAGAYGRIASLDGERAFEFDISAAHVDGRTGEATRWMPGQIFARLNVQPFGVPIELWHDGTYDLQEESTRYSFSSFALRPYEDLRFEVGHRRARDLADERLFEAATLAGIWRANEKWEFEGRQTISLKENENLDTGFVLRRFGHDLVFEIESSFREGDGSSIGFSLKPRFGWNPSDLGYVRY